MTRLLLRRATRAARAAASLCVAAACGRDAPPPPADSVVAPPPVVRVDSVPAVPVVARLTWSEAGAGPALLVHGDTAQPTIAFAVLRGVADSASDSAYVAAVSALDGVTVDLFALTGKVGTARVTAGARAAIAADPEECQPWPAVRLGTAPPAGAWRVALAAGRAVPIEVDSLEGLAGADSAGRTAEVARLASLVPRTNTREFAGLPFAVRQARRFTTAGVDMLVAEAVRKLGQEANPREQHVLLVAERPAGGRGKFELAYHETSVGDETEVETRDVLAALMVGEKRTVTLMLNREYGDAVAYSLLERMGARRWRVRWTSARVGCEEEG